MNARRLRCLMLVAAAVSAAGCSSTLSHSRWGGFPAYHDDYRYRSSIGVRLRGDDGFVYFRSAPGAGFWYRDRHRRGDHGWWRGRRPSLGDWGIRTQHWAPLQGQEPKYERRMHREGGFHGKARSRGDRDHHNGERRRWR